PAVQAACEQRREQDERDQVEETGQQDPAEDARAVARDRVVMQQEPVEDRQHREGRPQPRAPQPPPQAAGPDAVLDHANMFAMDDLLVCHLGAVEYRAATELQEQLRERRRRDEIGDVLLLLEHPPVYTRGRRTQDGELPMGEAWYATQGIAVVETPRGGRVT